MNAGMTMQSLAAETDVDIGQISRFERGSFATLSPNLQTLAAYLGVRTEAASPVSTEAATTLIERIARGRPERMQLVEKLLSAVDELDRKT